MKKFMLKMIFWLVIFGILGLAGYQNLSFFMNKYAFSINYYFGVITFPEIFTGLYIAGFFMAGFLMASLFFLGFRFRAGRTIKLLKKEVLNNDRMISSLSGGGPRTEASPDTGQEIAER